MSFSPEQVLRLQNDFDKTIQGLKDLQFKLVAEGQALESTSRIREHLLHGAGRRISIIRRSITNIYARFPLDSILPLDSESIDEVQINLHAFLMNAYGIFDNWAWAFVLRHDLEASIGDRRRIGMFHPATQRHFPIALKERLTTHSVTEWHGNYMKSFRDALAHRIPPYLPPAQFTDAEGARYNELESQKMRCIKTRQWSQLDEIEAEQARIGKPCFLFLHAYFEDTSPELIQLHPQVLADANTVIDIGQLFLAHWLQVSTP